MGTGRVLSLCWHYFSFSFSSSSGAESCRQLEFLLVLGSDTFFLCLSLRGMRRGWREGGLRLDVEYPRGWCVCAYVGWRELNTVCGVWIVEVCITKKVELS